MALGTGGSCVICWERKCNHSLAEQDEHMRQVKLKKQEANKCVDCGKLPDFNDPYEFLPCHNCGGSVCRSCGVVTDKPVAYEQGFDKTVDLLFNIQKRGGHTQMVRLCKSCAKDLETIK